MGIVLPDKKSLDLGNKKIKGKTSSDYIKTNFSTMLIDFKVIQYLVGFSIAEAFRQFLTLLLDNILINKLNIKSDLLVSFLVLVFGIICSFWQYPCNRDDFPSKGRIRY